MSDITGIQMTRVFRLFNGLEMKLSEYLKISEIIEAKIAEKTNVQNVFEECLNQLNLQSLIEIEIYCTKKLEMKKLVAQTMTQEVVA